MTKKKQTGNVAETGLQRNGGQGLQISMSD